MMQEWTVDQVRAAEARGRARWSKLTTRDEAAAYVSSVRQRIGESFGPLPEKTPLQARVTGVLHRENYKIEKLSFESRPGFPVTANLYLPVGRTFPRPGVVGLCGHSPNGKAAESYQAFAQGLARLGTVVLIIDPIGQGERLQFLTSKNRSRYHPGVMEHLQLGNQQMLVGDFLGTWFAWDGIRALDYLLARPEVDPRYVGVTGNSGGGTQTTWLCALETRWTMAAPSCFITTFRRNVENELPTDTEQCPPNCLALDLEHADFLSVQAPKPMLVLPKELDFFDVRGSEETYGRLAELYDLLGAGKKVQISTGPTYHGFSQESREAMYAFFRHESGESGPSDEPEITYESDRDLQVTVSGQVHNEIDTLTVFDMTRVKAEKLARDRRSMDSIAVRNAIERLLKMPVTSGTPDYRILRGLGDRRYPRRDYCVYAIETEPGIQALVTRLSDEPLGARPPRGIEQAVLYVSHRSADEELRSESLIKDLIKEEPHAAFYAMDVRGIGESQPDLCGRDQFLKEYGSDYFLSSHALMLGRPYLGQRTFDVQRVVDWLRAQGHTKVHLVGRGWGAIPAALAAVENQNVSRVTLKNALTSYLEIAKTADYRWPHSALLPNVLTELDLPDVYSALSEKRLRLIEPWTAGDGMRE